jgi:hypothetical protein
MAVAFSADCDCATRNNSGTRIAADCWATISLKLQKTRDSIREGLVRFKMAKMADNINELDMEFTRNVAEIITSNAEE